MLQGIILQAVHAPAGVEEPTPQVGQVMLIPAAKEIWFRELTAMHPRSTWKRRHTAYDPHRPWRSPRIETALEIRWDSRMDADWHLTGRPMGFQIKDDEFLELHGGGMPRNVALRAMRALEARNQLVIGAAAALRPANFRGINIPRLSRMVGLTVGERLGEFISDIDRAVDRDDLAVLNSVTPRSARARGAGRHINASGLPVLLGGPGRATGEVTPGPTAEPAPAPAAPAPVVEHKARSGAVKPGQRVVAADGVPYVARAVLADEKNLSDVELFKRAYEDSMNVLLLGEPGTGKTRGLLAAFPDAILVTVTGDTEVSDLVGSYVPTGPDSFQWVDGPLVKGMDEGRMVVMDEIGLADSKVLAVLYGLMDKTGTARKILITANPARGVVTAKDGFGIAGTTNPNAKGVHIAEPLLSRCAITMTVTSDYGVARDLGCNERLVQAAEHMSKQRETGEIGWAPEMRNLLDAKKIEEKFGVVMALRALIMQAPDMEREVVEIQLRERFGDIPGAAKKVRALGI